MGSIQSGDAQILTYTNGEMLSFRFDNCITLVLQSLTLDTWVSYSEGGLQSASQRFKVSADGTNTNTPLTLNFSQPRSGTLFFASANAGATSTITMWQI